MAKVAGVSVGSIYQYFANERLFGRDDVLALMGLSGPVAKLGRVARGRGLELRSATHAADASYVPLDAGTGADALLQPFVRTVILSWMKK